ncbi:hypothetical protein N7462_003164 [Penicillium macrosclerotiorum]|uniref:uncharacterized protein n=1 Tax=Penicillium macrosclerotiorum TaxID=303699 RepID=UPI00254700E2|nr:uncharacterized protein N7462_003164 [Penicillium macrosclerotiorum]KAJ5688772.1 hypothetical protein N7462_003164 [Penicillium macrosclerotiorum]
MEQAMRPIGRLSSLSLAAAENQNTVAQLTAIKKWRQRADAAPPAINVGLVQEPSSSLYDLAYERFCFDFVKPWPGSLSRLPRLLSETTSDSCLRSISTAIFYANFHGRCYSLDAKEASAIHYGQALQKLTRVMTDPNAIQQSEILMVIFLLSLYEMFTSDSRDGSWIAHMRGTQSVIAQRDISSLQDQGHYLASLCIHLAVYYVSERRLPPPHLYQWVQSTSFPFDRKGDLVYIMLKTASICFKLNQRCGLHRTGYSDSLEEDLALLDQALALDSDFEFWTSNLPPKWKQTGMTPISLTGRPDWIRDLFASPGAPQYTYRYTTRLAASDWNMCRATRIRLHIQILEFLSTCSYPVSAAAVLEKDSLDKLILFTDEIAATIPFALDISPNGGSDLASSNMIPGLWAYMMLWSTQSSLACLQHRFRWHRDTIQRADWFRQMLVFLRDATGMAKVDVFLQDNQLETF